MRSSTIRMFGAFTLARNSGSRCERDDFSSNRHLALKDRALVQEFMAPSDLDRAIVCFSSSSSRVHRHWTSLSKNRTNFYWIGSCLHGADAEIRVPAVPVAGDDAAVDAGDQAAAVVESRLVGLCRGGTGAK